MITFSERMLSVTRSCVCLCVSVCVCVTHMYGILQVCEEPPWQQLATATHLAQPPPAQPSGVTASKPHIHDWEQALQKNELQLLQLHMIQALSLPGMGVLGSVTSSSAACHA